MSITCSQLWAKVIQLSTFVLYCKASAIARKNNILIATRRLRTTTNEDTKEYYYRIYRNYVDFVVEQLQQRFGPMFACFAKATHLIPLYLGKFTLFHMLEAFYICNWTEPGPH